MSHNTHTPSTNLLEEGTETYERARVVIIPEGPFHYEVQVRENDVISRHAVERVVINAAEVLLDGPIWFIDVKLDVGVPVGEHGDVAWVWA